MTRFSKKPELENAPAGILQRGVERFGQYLNTLRTGFKGAIQKVLNRESQTIRPETVQDLKHLLKSSKLPDHPRVVYLGCGDDLSVQKVFPQSTHVDVDEEVRPHFKHFIKGDARNLSLATESLDLVVQSAMVYSVDSDPRSASEIARVLKSQGKMMRNFPALNEPTQLHEALRNLHYLLIHKNYASNGLCMEERISPQNVLFTKGTVDEGEAKKISEQLDQAKKTFFELLSNQPLEQFEDERESPFLYGRYAYHRAIEFVLGVDLQAGGADFDEQLTRLRVNLNAEDFQKVQSMASKLKVGWDEVRRKHQLN